MAWLASRGWSRCRLTSSAIESSGFCFAIYGRVPAADSDYYGEELKETHHTIELTACMNTLYPRQDDILLIAVRLPSSRSCLPIMPMAPSSRIAASGRQIAHFSPCRAFFHAHFNIAPSSFYVKT